MTAPEMLRWRFFSDGDSHGEIATGTDGTEYRIHYDGWPEKGHRLTSRMVRGREDDHYDLAPDVYLATPSLARIVAQQIHPTTAGGCNRVVAPGRAPMVESSELAPDVPTNKEK